MLRLIGLKEKNRCQIFKVKTKAIHWHKQINRKKSG